MEYQADHAGVTGQLTVICHTVAAFGHVVLVEQAISAAIIGAALVVGAEYALDVLSREARVDTKFAAAVLEGTFAGSVIKVGAVPAIKWVVICIGHASISVLAQE